MCGDVLKIKELGVYMIFQTTQTGHFVYPKLDLIGESNVKQSEEGNQRPECPV